MQLVAVSVFNTAIPPENHKAIPIALDFTTQSVIQFDAFMLQEVLTQVNFLQGIYFDGADVNGPISATAGTTGQRIVCPAKSQGYAPLMISDPPAITFQCTVPVLMKVLLTNFHLPVGFWKVG